MPRTRARDLAACAVIASAIAACGGGTASDDAPAPVPSPPSVPAALPSAIAAACTPQPSAVTALASSMPVWNLGVAASGGDVFFRTFGPHTVWRIPDGGGTPSKVWTGSVGIFGAGIAITNGFAYWSGLDSERGGLEAVFRAPVRGGPALVVGYLPSYCAAYGGLGIDDRNVYAATIACNVGKATVSKMPLGGGGTVTLWTDDAWTIGGLAVADDAIVISTATGDGDNDEDDRGSIGEVLAIPKRGGPAEVLAHVTLAGPIATDGDRAYFIDGDVLASVPLGGGAVQTLAKGMRYGSSLAVDGRGVYVAIGGTMTSQLHQGAIVFVPKDGGAKTVLASKIDQLGSILVDRGVVYWSTLGSPDGAQHGGVFRLDSCAASR